MKAVIVSIGTSLLLSDVLDTNSTYLSRGLQDVGIELIYKVTVGDDAPCVADTLRQALLRADVVLTTGGLKPGPESITRQAVVAATNTWLDPESFLPADGRILGQVHGDETGFMIENLPGLLICLPDDRRTLAYLMETEVLPHLRAQTDPKSGSLILRTVGVMESSLREQLGDLHLLPTQQIGFDSYAGQTNIRLRVKAETEADIQSQLAQLRQEILARLGDHVFGQNEDRLETAILAMLQKGRYRLAVAECHTDRLLSRLLAHASEAAETIMTLPFTTEQELAQALEMPAPVSDETITHWCRKIAEALVAKTAVHLGLLVYHEAMPGGVQLSVYLATAQGISVTQRSFGGHPENINQWACTLGLAHLHRWLLAYPGGTAVL